MRVFKDQNEMMDAMDPKETALIIPDKQPPYTIKTFAALAYKNEDGRVFVFPGYECKRIE